MVGCGMYCGEPVPRSCAALLSQAPVEPGDDGRVSATDVDRFGSTVDIAAFAPTRRH